MALAITRANACPATMASIARTILTNVYRIHAITAEIVRICWPLTHAIAQMIMMDLSATSSGR